MPWFARRSGQQTASPFRDLAESMERFGRFEYYKTDSGENPGAIYNDVIAPLYPLATSDPHAFLGALAQQASARGGWAAYGAGHAVWELLTGDARDQLRADPSYRAVMDASLQFLRDNGVPPMRVTGYEWDYWVDAGGSAQTWLPPLPLPPRDATELRELHPGEERPVARLAPEKDANVIIVRQAEAAGYEALIDARWSDEDPRRSRSHWKSAESLYDLYVLIGNSLQTPSPWHDPELGPFFPLPAPRI